MADLAETDVTIAITKRIHHNGLKEIWGTATFGTGSLTYATGGVPCSKGKFGFLKEVVGLEILSVSTNYLCDYLISTAKFYLKYCDYDAGADGVLIEVANGATPASTVIGFHAYGI